MKLPLGAALAFDVLGFSGVVLLMWSSWASTREQEPKVTGDGLEALGGEQGLALVPSLWQRLQQAQIQSTGLLVWLLEDQEPGLVTVTPTASTGSSPAHGHRVQHH